MSAAPIALVEDLAVDPIAAMYDPEPLDAECPSCQVRNARGSVARGVYVCGCGSRGRVRTGVQAVLDQLREDRL